MTLKEKRIKFTKLLCALIQWGDSHANWEVALGRDFDEANEKIRHMAGSLHYMGLANDLALYVDGVYQEGTEAYRELGLMWKSYDKDCCWGGDFKKADGNHFSVTFGGKK